MAGGVQGVAAGAYWLDQWLRQRIGRVYRLILAVGLVLGIASSVESLSHTVITTANVVSVALAVVMQIALLINQLAQLHEHRQARRERRNADPKAGA